MPDGDKLPLDVGDDASPPSGAASDTAPPPMTGDTAPKRGRGRPRSRPSTAKDSAPSSSARKPGRPLGSTKQAGQIAALERKLNDTVTGVALIVGSMGAGAGNDKLQLDGMILANGAGDFSAALAKAAGENDKLYAALDRLLTASAYAELIAATAAIVIPIAANHGLVPAQLTAVTDLAGGAAPTTEPAPNA